MRRWQTDPAAPVWRRAGLPGHLQLVIAGNSSAWPGAGSSADCRRTGLTGWALARGYVLARGRSNRQALDPDATGAQVKSPEQQGGKSGCA